MSNTLENIIQAYAGEECKLYTIKGIENAIVCNTHEKYATIKSEDSNIAILVNWPTVERKMQSDKLFYAC